MVRPVVIINCSDDDSSNCDTREYEDQIEDLNDNLRYYKNKNSHLEEKVKELKNKVEEKTDQYKKAVDELYQQLKKRVNIFWIQHYEKEKNDSAYELIKKIGLDAACKEIEDFSRPFFEHLCTEIKELKRVEDQRNKEIEEGFRKMNEPYKRDKEIFSGLNEENFMERFNLMVEKNRKLLNIKD